MISALNPTNITKGYWIFTTVLIVVLSIILIGDFSPWLNFFAPITALIGSRKFIKSMSLWIVSGIVLFFTLMLPVGLLIVIGSGVGAPSLLADYLHYELVFKMFFPTILLVVVWRFIEPK